MIFHLTVTVVTRSERPSTNGFKNNVTGKESQIRHHRITSWDWKLKNIFDDHGGRCRAISVDRFKQPHNNDDENNNYIIYCIRIWVIRLYNIVVVMMADTGSPFFAPDTPFGSVFSGDSRPVETTTHSSPAAALQKSGLHAAGLQRRSYYANEYYCNVCGQRPRNIRRTSRRRIS